MCVCFIVEGETTKYGIESMHENKKIQFALAMCDQKAVNELDTKVSEVAKEAIRFYSTRTDHEIKTHRERVVRNIRKLANGYSNDGKCKAWASSADEKTKVIIQHVNGPLMKALLLETGYVDKECVELFVEGCVHGFSHPLMFVYIPRGGSLIGKLPFSGTCEKMKETISDDKVDENIQALRKNVERANGKLVQSLKPEKHAQAIFDEIMEEVKLGKTIWYTCLTFAYVSLLQVVWRSRSK